MRKEIIRQIQLLFADTKRPASTTLADLEAIRDQVEMLIQALEADGVEADED